MITSAIVFLLLVCHPLYGSRLLPILKFFGTQSLEEFLRSLKTSLRIHKNSSRLIEEFSEKSLGIFGVGKQTTICTMNQMIRGISNGLVCCYVVVDLYSFSVIRYSIFIM